MLREGIDGRLLKKACGVQSCWKVVASSGPARNSHSSGSHSVPMLVTLESCTEIHVSILLSAHFANLWTWEIMDVRVINLPKQLLGIPQEQATVATQGCHILMLLFCNVCIGVSLCK